jgi:transcriptional repressor NrdR
MYCPFCKFASSEVKDSRITSDKNSIRRRRICLSCQAKFTTYEKVELNTIYVIKKSGVKKVFDIEKITHSITTALRKRNITIGQISEISLNILKQIEALGINYISTSKIGALIMQELLNIDQVGYIRFASVYKDFNSVDDFITFIKKLKKRILGEK